MVEKILTLPSYGTEIKSQKDCVVGPNFVLGRMMDAATTFPLLRDCRDCTSTEEFLCIWASLQVLADP